MGKLISYADAIKKTQQKDKSLLLGNGFSIAQNPNFGYKNLLEKSNLAPKSPIRKIFQEFKTVDFEIVIHALEHTAKVLEAYAASKSSKKFEGEAEKVRNALIDAVQNVHPAIQTDISPAEKNSCATFLSKFKKVFTVNYDLLAYWVNLNADPHPHDDGFGLRKTSNHFRTFDAGASCSIYNLHGGLHLFNGAKRSTLKKVASGKLIVDAIKESISEGKIPLIVAEGTSSQKVTKINSVPYLRHCHEQLYNQAAPLFIFGHSADVKDDHIYEAIFEGKTPEIYFCVHEPKNNLKEIRKRLAKFKEIAPSKKLNFIDSAEVSVWK